MQDKLMISMLFGLMSSKPQDWLDLPHADTEVTIHFPSAALLGLDRVMGELEHLGFVLPDRMTALEVVIGFVMGYGLSALAVQLMPLVGGANGPEDKRSEDKKED